MENTVELIGTLHKFEKTNLVSQRNKRGIYDSYKCINCGIEGKRYGFDNHPLLNKTYSSNTLKSCKNIKDIYLGMYIKITHCDAVGSEFIGCTSGSIHKIVRPPKNQVNGDRGVWIYGKTEPIKLLFGEFVNYITLRRTKHK